MSHSTASSMITLVDFDGGPVPLWERDAPIVPPPGDDDDSDPTLWPAWTDGDRWVLSEAIPTMMASVQLYAIEPDDDEYRPSYPEASYDPTPEDLEEYARYVAGLDAARLDAWPMPVSGGSPDEDLDDERAMALVSARMLDQLAPERTFGPCPTGCPWS